MSSALIKKLKLKNNQRILLLNPPENYVGVLKNLSNNFFVTQEINAKPFDVVHLFASNQTILKKFGKKSLQALSTDGLLWISFPKKTSKIQTDLTRDHGWDDFLNFDLRFITLISFDETWSAILFKKGKKEESIIKSENLAIIEKYIDAEKRVIKIPDDLQLKFKSHQAEAEFFSSLSFTNRKEYVVWLVTAKQEETKSRRLKAIIEKLQQKKKNPSDR